MAAVRTGCRREQSVFSADPAAAFTGPASAFAETSGSSCGGSPGVRTAPGKLFPAVGLLFSLQLPACRADPGGGQSDAERICRLGKQLLLSQFFPVSAGSIHCRRIFSAPYLHPAPPPAPAHGRPLSGLFPAGQSPAGTGRTGRHRQQSDGHLFRHTGHCMQCRSPCAAPGRHAAGTAERLPADPLRHHNGPGTAAAVSSG